MVGGLAHLLKDLCGSLGSLPHITKQQDEEFFGVINWHEYFLL
jgi:hypothetical protein